MKDGGERILGCAAVVKEKLERRVGMLAELAVVGAVDVVEKLVRSRTAQLERHRPAALRLPHLAASERFSRDSLQELQHIRLSQPRVKTVHSHDDVLVPSTGEALGEDVVVVDGLVEFLVGEEVAEEVLDVGDVGADEDDVVDLALVDVGVLDGLLDGAEEVGVELLEAGAADGGVEVDALEEAVDLDGGLSAEGEGELGVFAGDAKTANGGGVVADVLVVLALEVPSTVPFRLFYLCPLIALSTIPLCPLPVQPGQATPLLFHSPLFCLYPWTSPAIPRSRCVYSGLAYGPFCAAAHTFWYSRMGMRSKQQQQLGEEVVEDAIVGVLPREIKNFKIYNRKMIYQAADRTSGFEITNFELR